MLSIRSNTMHNLVFRPFKACCWIRLQTRRSATKHDGQRKAPVVDVVPRQDHTLTFFGFFGLLVVPPLSLLCATPPALGRVPSAHDLPLNPSPSCQSHRRGGRVGLPQQGREYQRSWNHEKSRDGRHFGLGGVVGGLKCWGAGKRLMICRWLCLARALAGAFYRFQHFVASGQVQELAMRSRGGAHSRSVRHRILKQLRTQSRCIANQRRQCTSSCHETRGSCSPSCSILNAQPQGAVVRCSTNSK